LSYGPVRVSERAFHAIRRPAARQRRGGAARNERRQPEGKPCLRGGLRDRLYWRHESRSMRNAAIRSSRREAESRRQCKPAAGAPNSPVSGSGDRLGGRSRFRGRPLQRN